MLENGHPAVVNHKGDVLVLASESKAHAQAVARPNVTKPKPKRVKQQPPLPSDRHPSVTSDRFSSPVTPRQQTMSPAHSPPLRAAKRAKVSEQLIPPVRPRVVSWESQQQPGLGQAGPSTLAPPFVAQATARGVSPVPIPAYADPRASSMPPQSLYGQPAFPPHLYPPPMQQMHPAMYPNTGYPQMSQYWSQPPPWQQPQQPHSTLAPASFEEYTRWRESQGPQ